MRKIDSLWVRPEAVEAVAQYEAWPDRSIITLASGAMRTVNLSVDAVVAILTIDTEEIRSWGDHEIRRLSPRFEGTVPRD